jgi:hypothetical protein
LREASSQNTFCGQNSPEIHFGFGDAANIDSLRVEWPLGQIDVYTGVQTNTVYAAVEGEGLNPLITAVEDESPAVLLGFALEQNYPNPFSQIPRFAGNPSTVISFQLPVSSKVRLAIYSITGQLVRTLVDRGVAAGAHSAAWDGRNDHGHMVASGVYVYKLEAGAFVETRKMSFVR